MSDSKSPPPPRHRAAAAAASKPSTASCVVTITAAPSFRSSVTRQPSRLGTGLTMTFAVLAVVIGIALAVPYFTANEILVRCQSLCRKLIGMTCAGGCQCA
jgi:hypothetical protein